MLKQWRRKVGYIHFPQQFYTLSHITPIFKTFTQKHLNSSLFCLEKGLPATGLVKVSPLINHVFESCGDFFWAIFTSAFRIYYTFHILCFKQLDMLFIEKPEFYFASEVFIAADSSKNSAIPILLYDYIDIWVSLSHTISRTTTQRRQNNFKINFWNEMKNCIRMQLQVYYNFLLYMYLKENEA